MPSERFMFIGGLADGKFLNAPEDLYLFHVPVPAEDFLHVADKAFSPDHSLKVESYTRRRISRTVIVFALKDMDTETIFEKLIERYEIRK